jgi:hypothetical protein
MTLENVLNSDIEVLHIALRVRKDAAGAVREEFEKRGMVCIAVQDSAELPDCVVMHFTKQELDNV